MEALIKVFNGHELTFRKVSDRWCLTAQQLGEALGYADPSRQINKLIERHRQEVGSFVGVVKVATPGGDQDVTVIFDQGIPLLTGFARTARAAEFRLMVATLLVEIQSGTKQVHDSELLAAMWSELKALREKQSAAVDPKALIAGAIANKLELLSPAVQKIVVTQALALPPDVQSVWTASQISDDLSRMGIIASREKVGKVAKAHGIQCPKEEQENEFGYWAETSVNLNGAAKIYPQFQYRKVARDRIIAILTAANAGQAVG